MIDLEERVVELATKLGKAIARAMRSDVESRRAAMLAKAQELVLADLENVIKSPKRRGASPSAQKRGRTVPDARRAALPKGKKVRAERGGGYPVAARRGPNNPSASTDEERDDTSDRNDDGAQGEAPEEAIATTSQPAPAKAERVGARAGSAPSFPRGGADRFARIETAARARRGG